MGRDYYQQILMRYFVGIKTSDCLIRLEAKCKINNNKTSIVMVKRHAWKTIYTKYKIWD